MHSALVLGFGQIGTQIARDLAAAGTEVRVMTRQRPQDLAEERAQSTTRSAAVSADPAQTDDSAGPTSPAPGRITWRQGDASSAEAVRLAATDIGAEAIFACVHTAYDSRIWTRTLPGLETAIMDAAAALDIPVVFPESVYAFAGLTVPITAESEFAPVEEKGRIRRRLLDARAAHPAHAASVLAGDLIGATASPSSSVIRACITDRIAAGRRAVVPARTDVAHGITVIDDLAAAMIDAVQGLASDDGTHRLLVAPSANPTLADVAAYAHDVVGSRFRQPIALPHAAVRATGWFDRSMHELAELAPIWRRPCVIDSSGAEADWRFGIDAMLR